jgi:ABC-type branched-subunit amino acid transport system substrate-binding protein
MDRPVHTVGAHRAAERPRIARRRRRRAAALATAGALAATILSAAGPAGAGTTGPGITPTQIDVGAIASATGPEAGDFAAFIPGVEAYFAMVDAHGGVDGRKLVLSANLDDGGSPAQFTQEAHTLLQQDHVFAAFISTYWFTPGLFEETGTPTYGYNVSDNWAGPANFFAAGGSIQDYHALAAPVAYLVKRTHSRSVALVSYGPGIPGSYPACRTAANDLSKAGLDVSYTGLDATLGGDYTAEAQQIAQRHSDFVLTCMQDSDDITLSRALQQYGVKAHQLWLNGYNQDLLDAYPSLMQGVYVDANGFVPFSAPSAFPGAYPGMAAYLAAMKRYQPRYVTNQLAMQGWQSAALLVAGVKAAGSDLTQANLVAQTNRITAFTAGGTFAVVNWTKAHTTQAYPICPSFIQVKGTSFVPVVASGHQVFICFGRTADLKDPTPVAPPAGTPG